MGAVSTYFHNKASRFRATCAHPHRSHTYIAQVYTNISNTDATVKTCITHTSKQKHTVV